MNTESDVFRFPIEFIEKFNREKLPGIIRRMNKKIEKDNEAYDKELKEEFFALTAKARIERDKKK